MGSLPTSGRDPYPLMPRMVTLMVVALAISGPAFSAIEPAGTSGESCSAST